MTALRQLQTPTGLTGGDHVFWTFTDPTDFCAAVLPYLDEGRRRGEQLVLAGSSATSLLEAVDSLPERDELLATGQLQVRSIAEMGDPERRLEPATQVKALQCEVEAALRRGRTGLRLAADVTSLALGGVDERRQLHRYERLADSLMATVPLTAMCLFEASLDAEVLGPIAVLHPEQRRGNRELPAYLSGGGPWLSLHGEVDIDLADAVLRALVDVARDAPGEVVLDLADLEFLDVAGARALAKAVSLLVEIGVELRLVRPRRLVRRCLELFDLADGQGAST